MQHLTGGGALAQTHVISIKSRYHNSINIKCNAYESNTNTNTKAPHGMPLVNRHGHLTLTKMEAHGAERSGGEDYHSGNPDSNRFE